jgi:hypothetical protein
LQSFVSRCATLQAAICAQANIIPPDQISASLYSFVDDARQVDSNVSSLIEEIRGLSQVLDAISKSLANNDSVGASPSTESLLVNVDSSLKDCSNTLQKLDQMLKDLDDKGSFRMNILRKPVKQVKLNMKMKDFLAFKQRVYSHYGSMQLALQTINV